MKFRIGQKVAYPNLGVCSVESIENKAFGINSVEVYSLKIMADESVIFVPTANTDSVRLRPIINSIQCESVMSQIAEDFTTILPDWKTRSREFTDKIQTGDIFQVADVLKKLTFLSRQKSLSFREQRIWEKAKFLVVSELATVCSQPECNIETKINELLNIACDKHELSEVEFVSVATN